MNCLLIRLLLFSIIFHFSIDTQSQVQGKLIQLADLETYQIFITPNKTLIAPDNITNTGQITLKASTGSLTLMDFKTINGLWQFNSRINHPPESPKYDYFIFNLTTPLINPNYQIGVEFPLFQFKNANGCLGSIEIVENNFDAFWPPNSLQANIGNHLTILGFGAQNAYHENSKEQYKITCPNQLEFSLYYKPVKCVDENAQVWIHFEEGIEPFHYSVINEEGGTFHGVLPNRGDSILYNLSIGTHTFKGYNSLDTIIKDLMIKASDSLQIEIITLEKIGCEDTDGAKVKLSGRGSLAPDTYLYEWSDGNTGSSVEGLEAGNYIITLSDAYNCFTTKEIIIEKSTPIHIDSMLAHKPTCYDDIDGLIEVYKVGNATPPIQYALNKSNFQRDNYFDNLKAGSYQVHIKDAFNCRTSQEIVINNPPKLTIELPNDTTLLLGQSISALPSLKQTSNLYYEWSPSPFLSCLDCANPIIRPTQDITLSLLVSNEDGCTATTKQKIKVLQKRPVFIPTAFSPNGDGVNDLFEIHIGPTIKAIHSLTIFNRWGQLIYQSSMSSTPILWDGTFKGQPVESGTYLYIAEIEMDNQEIEIYKGDFFILK